MEFSSWHFSAILIYVILQVTYLKLNITLLRISLVISSRIWSALPEDPVCLEPPWVRSKDSKRTFVCWRSLEISTFSCNPNISGCWVNGSFYQKIDSTSITFSLDTLIHKVDMCRPKRVKNQLNIKQQRNQTFPVFSNY